METKHAAHKHQKIHQKNEAFKEAETNPFISGQKWPHQKKGEKTPQTTTTLKQNFYNKRLPSLSSRLSTQ